MESQVFPFWDLITLVWPPPPKQSRELFHQDEYGNFILETSEIQESLDSNWEQFSDYLERQETTRRDWDRGVEGKENLPWGGNNFITLWTDIPVYIPKVARERGRMKNLQIGITMKQQSMRNRPRLGFWTTVMHATVEKCEEINEA